MIGITYMEISPEQMCQMVQYWWNEQLGFHERHQVQVLTVRQRDNKRFVITFEGKEPMQLRRSVVRTASTGEKADAA